MSSSRHNKDVNRSSHEPIGRGLTVRDLRFRGAAISATPRNPVAAAWFTSLSAGFPRGEAMFIEAVKAHREGVPDRLARDIRDFIRQEINHTREHVYFNRAAEESGYDLKEIDRRIAALVSESQNNPPVVTLAITMALEHFTAMFAAEFLRNPGSVADSGIGVPDLWLWHAVEEIEHKAVAFDAWMYATRDWKPRKRWLVRALVMLRVTRKFLWNRSADAVYLMKQDGVTTLRAWLRLTRYLFVSPGILRHIAPAWLSWFRPGFHPWDQDDSALIAQYDGAVSNTSSGDSFGGPVPEPAE